LGLEQFLAERIFNQIDGNKDGIITFEDFVKYLSMLLNGSTIEKALWSFGMLSSIHTPK
jgi:Ca2+-binding EF-hand superfamily protein